MERDLGSKQRGFLQRHVQVSHQLCFGPHRPKCLSSLRVPLYLFRLRPLIPRGQYLLLKQFSEREANKIGRQRALEQELQRL